jgi:hypothetical protein
MLPRVPGPRRRRAPAAALAPASQTVFVAAEEDLVYLDLLLERACRGFHFRATPTATQPGTR